MPSQKSRAFLGCVSVACLLGLANESLAQGESILFDDLESMKTTVSVRELHSEGRHFDAVVAAKKRHATLELSEELAAAKSAWALGLTDEARTRFEAALVNPALVGRARQKVILSRALLELQEGNVEQARSIAEKAAAKLEASEMRAHFWLVIGEALREQGAYSIAEDYYKKAVDESTGRTKYQAFFLLGECLMKLGRISDARYQFTSIETTSGLADKALRRLAEIDFTQRNYESVLTWINEGKQSHADAFSDPWVSYAEIVSLVETKRLQEGISLLKDLRSQIGKDNSWFILADARVERARIEEIEPRARLTSGE